MSKSAEGVGCAEGSHAPADNPHHPLQHGMPLLDPKPVQSGGVAGSSPFSPPFHATATEDDFRWLAQDVGRRPTRLDEVVPEVSLYNGTFDAPGLGVGGVYGQA